MRVSTPANIQREESHPRAGSQSQVRVNETELIYFLCSRSDMVLDKVFVCLFFSVSFRISDLCPPHTQFCSGSFSICVSDSRADFQMLQDERYMSDLLHYIQLNSKLIIIIVNTV